MGPVNNPLLRAGDVKFPARKLLAIADSLDKWINYERTSTQVEQEHPEAVRACLHPRRKQVARILNRDRILAEVSAQDVLCLFYQVLVVRRYDAVLGGFWYIETRSEEVHSFVTGGTINLETYGAASFSITRLLPTLTRRTFENKANCNPVNLPKRPMAFMGGFVPPDEHDKRVASIYSFLRAVIRAHGEGYFIDLCLRTLLPLECRQAIGIEDLQLSESIKMILSMFCDSRLDEQDIFLFPYTAPPSVIGKRANPSDDARLDYPDDSRSLQEIFQERVSLLFSWAEVEPDRRARGSKTRGSLKRAERSALKDAAIAAIQGANYSHRIPYIRPGSDDFYEASEILLSELQLRLSELEFFIPTKLPMVTDYCYGSEPGLSAVVVEAWEILGKNLLTVSDMTSHIRHFLRYCARMHLGLVVGGFETARYNVVHDCEMLSSICLTENLFVYPRMYLEACASVCATSFFYEVLKHVRETGSHEYDPFLGTLFMTRSVIANESFESVFSSRTHLTNLELWSYAPLELSLSMYRSWVAILDKEEARRLLPPTHNPETCLLVQLYRMFESDL